MPQLAGLFARAEALVQSWESAHPLALVTAAAAATPGGLTPAQVAHAYGFDQIFFPGGVAGNGAGQTIAIVDAYNDPTAATDLHAFDVQFGLPDPALYVANQNGGAVRPPADPSGGWQIEESLDVQWAHAMAPAATIVLVEANSSSMPDLLAGVRTAATLPGVSVVSMSWIAPEAAAELSWNSAFLTPAGHQGVTFVAASGDYGSAGYTSGAAPGYPAASPNVLTVGGTDLYLNANGSVSNEIAWAGSGGGFSTFEPEPAWQRGVQSTGVRSSPDVSYNAGIPVAVFDSALGGWVQVAGTSAGAPQWAALIAIANQGRSRAGLGTLDGPAQTIPAIYQMAASDFRDIIGGNNGGLVAAVGYDLVTGRGSPIANLVVAGLGVQVMSAPTAAASRPPAPANPFVELADLEAIAIEQFDSLAYRLLTLIDPRDFAVPAAAVQQQLTQNPMLPTPQGQQAAALGRVAFAQALSQ